MKSKKLSLSGSRNSGESEAILLECDTDEHNAPSVPQPETSPGNLDSKIIDKSHRPSRSASRLLSTKNDVSQGFTSHPEPKSLNDPQLIKGGSRRASLSRKLKPEEPFVPSSNGHEKANQKMSTKGISLRTSSRRAASTGSEQLQPHPVLDPSKLVAIQPSGNIINVSLVLANRPYVVDDFENSVTSSPSVSPTSHRQLSPTDPSSTTSGIVSSLGYDGNQYYCQVCNGFGDVVCCDGCPRVYHPGCIPPEDPSRISLDSDDDPWYCPECIEVFRNKATRIGSVADENRKKKIKSGIRSSDSKSSNLHHSEASKSEKSSEQTIRSSPTASQNMHHKAEVVIRYPVESKKDMNPNSNKRVEPHSKTIALSVSDDGAGNQDSFMGFDSKESDKKRTKRLKTKKDSSSYVIEPNAISEVSFERNGKAKKRKHVSGAGSTATVEYESSIQEGNSFPTFSEGIVQAIPAFYFYLNENRWKIERALARKHRYFNRLPKGVERNELVAREAAMWWVKLRPTDINRYMTMSMRDYETRIIEWKEEKNLREMGYCDESNSLHEQHVYEIISGDPVTEEERIRFEKHEKLYLSTSVGSKPFKPEEGQSYNRVLLDLLHDTRFHPLPMFFANRPETDPSFDENRSKSTIPFFEVHGPVATSVGDECLGCSRGWIHHCLVLQRRIPAIEHRAKLQPPISSLVATRVGLGLRPKLERSDELHISHYDEIDISPERDVMVWSDSDQTREVKNLSVVPFCSVPDPGDRIDDVVQFIEETTAMKVPEPPRPSVPEKSTAFHHQRDHLQNEEMNLLSKCGRCRTIIENDTGCVPCRRAQLVINKSKASSSSSDLSTKSAQKTLKIHSAMLGRIQIKEGGGDGQSENDQAVAEAILRVRWSPSSILPPQTVFVPSTSLSSHPVVTNDTDSDDYSLKESVGVEKSGLLDSPALDATVQTGGAVIPEVSTIDERPSKRLRAFKIASTSTDEIDRQEIVRQYKKESNEVNKKAVQIACYGILLALTRRDPLHLFALPVTAEGYNTIIQNPIDFGKVRENVLAEKYSSFRSFTSDVRLLCENALAYNPPLSIYYKTAKDMLDALIAMQKRAIYWIATIKDAHQNFLHFKKQVPKRNGDASKNEDEAIQYSNNLFKELRQTWPEAVRMFERGDILRKAVESDFLRTQENETAYYGCLAVSRAAAAAQFSLAPYPDSSGIHAVVAKRKCYDDELLREYIDRRVSQIVGPVQLNSVSTWREESVIRLMRKVQNRRLERRSLSDNGCSRCDGIMIENEPKAVLNVDATNPTKTRKKNDFDFVRVDPSRICITTGLGSLKIREKISKRQESGDGSGYNTINEASVSVRGSRIHGMGLFADQPFKKGDVVAEYIGEYIVNPVADEREKIYRDQRIQDYQFRFNDKLIIDATMKGGPGRYINHNCTPNCFAKIIPFTSQKLNGLEDPESDNESKEDNLSELLRRVVIVAQRNIEINEEITYDYQFPLELDLSARIPCNCQSDACRGFMNWDLPEKGSNNRALLVQKRGANMRDRIRRLGRPLKRDEP